MPREGYDCADLPADAPGGDTRRGPVIRWCGCYHSGPCGRSWPRSPRRLGGDERRYRAVHTDDGTTCRGCGCARAARLEGV